jgi:AhpD family alkylhydroperoxidase
MGSLAKTLDVKTRDGIALAVSEADGCDYCLAAHSYIATNLAKIAPDEIELNRKGRSADPKRQAAVAFAKAVIETRGRSRIPNSPPSKSQAGVTRTWSR